MKVCEIFKSIEGEGLRTGLAAVFVRLHGCNLRCSYCDSMYAVEGNDYKQMSVAQVVDAINAYHSESGVKCVTLTGGEPLLHVGSGELLQILCDKGFEVNVETNGTVPCKYKHSNLFYTMDWKCKSSGMSSKMQIENIATLGKNDVLKFVVGSIEDLNETENVVTRLFAVKEQNADKMPHIFVSPVFGALEYETIVEWTLSSRIMTENNARFQVQLHKVVWDPDKRGV
ncbi:MAG: radical SAM protein [Fibrobacter sp.]|nr:radical SAM protein [Fibrobacter sp.]